VLRLVQKYIERPLLLTRSHPDFNLRKFDIRQWVLVTRLKPLQAYLFSGSYLRFSKEPYSPGRLDEPTVHLTNYSQNPSPHSYMLASQFAPLLEAETGLLWAEAVAPQVETLVLEALSATAPAMQDRPGCFELLGFDILLDASCHAWLLEVNQSPACEARGQDLSDMAEAMAEQMLRLVLAVNPEDHLPHISPDY
jgi:tubulin polyglutamylase TTLL6/13